MARTDEPGSATTHFFILVAMGPTLTASSSFGRVTRGIEVVDAISGAVGKRKTRCPGAHQSRHRCCLVK
jgi:cyclophilin family peptidyl-prolyl cis-trans isomerase